MSQPNPRTFIALPTLMASCLFSLSAVLVDPAVGKGGLSQNEADKLIQQLGAEKFSDREKAAQMLWEGGSPFLTQLKKAAQSDDPELRERSRELHQRISTGLSPNADPKILERVRQIRLSNNIDEIENLLELLYDEEAYREIIFLYTVHSDPAVKAALLEHGLGAVIYEASGALSDGDFVLAESLLRQFPVEGDVADALAAIYQHQGRLGVESKRLLEQGQEMSSLMLSIHRQLGDLPAMAEWARKKGDLTLLARVEMLMGAPHRITDQMGKYYYSSTNRSQSVSQKEGVKLAQALSTDDGKGVEEAMEALSRLGAVGADSRLLTEVYTQFLVNGESQPFEEAFNRFYIGHSDYRFRDFAMRYVDLLEREELIFKATFLPAEREGLSDWVRKTVSRAELADENDVFGELAGADLRRLYTVAEVFHQKGEEDLVRKVLGPLFERVRKVDIQVLGACAARCVNRKMGWFLAEQLSKYSAEELEVVSSALYSKVKYIGVVEEYLSSKSKDPSVVLAQLLVLSSYDRVSKNYDVVQLHGDLVAHAETLKPKARLELLRSLYLLAYNRGEARTSLALLRVLRTAELATLKEGAVGEYESVYLSLLKGLGLWGELDAVLRQKEEKGEEVIYDQDYGSWYIALMNMGRKQEAAEKLKLCRLYGLNELNTLNVVAAELMLHGFEEEAMSFYQKILLKAEFDSREFRNAVESINLYYAVLVRQKKWKVAYSLALTNKYLAVLGVNGQLESSSTFSPNKLLTISHQVDLTRGMMLLETDRNLAMKLLRRCVKTPLSGGRCIDFYFDTLKEAGLNELHEEAFRRLYGKLEGSLKAYPTSFKTYNSAAWLAARCGYELENAEKYVRKSLELAPHTSAYTDTLAEVFFVKGNREKAVELGELALKQAEEGKQRGSGTVGDIYYGGPSCRSRLEHFKNDPIPSR